MKYAFQKLCNCFTTALRSLANLLPGESFKSTCYGEQNSSAKPTRVSNTLKTLQLKCKSKHVNNISVNLCTPCKLIFPYKLKMKQYSKMPQQILKLYHLTCWNCYLNAYRVLRKQSRLLLYQWSPNTKVMQ